MKKLCACHDIRVLSPSAYKTYLSYIYFAASSLCRSFELAQDDITPPLALFTMSDFVNQKVFDDATADDVALEQLGYQQGLQRPDIKAMSQLLTSS